MDALGKGLSLVDWTDGRSRSQIVGRGGPKSCEVDVLPEMQAIEPSCILSCIAECQHAGVRSDLGSVKIKSYSLCRIELGWCAVGDICLQRLVGRGAEPSICERPLCSRLRDGALARPSGPVQPIDGGLLESRD